MRTTTRWVVLSALAAGALVTLVASQSLAATLAEELVERLRTGIDAATSEAEVDALVLLGRFYQERHLAPVWVTGHGATDRAAALAGVLKDADADGLDPHAYGAEAVQALLPATRAEDLAELELRLSLGVIRITADLAAGRLEPSRVDPELFIFPAEIDQAQVIRDAADSADIAAFVGTFRPAQDEYRRLKAALAVFRQIAAAGGWPEVPDGPTLEPGMRDPRVVALRARLRATGQLGPDQDRAAAGGDPTVYDDQLVAAVERFQDRHGLEPDGRVGKATLGELNVPAEQRVRQILINLERRRWMPDDPGARYVFVNLADFHLKVVDGPKTVFDTRVVVGAPYHRTPAFSGAMTYLEINPYWHVPPSIARNELLPRIQADPGYLAAGNFDLLSGWSDGAALLDPYSIDWSRVSPEDFAFKIRQQPGPGNALGRIKFMFPNRFNVYLHDTPARALFDKNERSFSHGCIRVEHPERLGALMLEHEPGWSLKAIEAAIASGERQIVRLSAPVPVHIAYLTAWVNKDGSVHFRRDVYGRDRLLEAALLGPRASAP
jgi:murein L,D-transpeptidase YcbB/YkuD